MFLNVLKSDRDRHRQRYKGTEFYSLGPMQLKGSDMFCVDWRFLKLLVGSLAKSTLQ